MKSIEEFYQEFSQDVYYSADGGEQYAEDAFFEIFCDHMIGAGELETADRVQYLAPRGLRIDGYGGDPVTSDNVLSLIIADYNQSTVIETLTASDMDAIFNRLSNFLVKSLDQTFRDSLEETGPAFGLADLISKRWPGIEKVRLFLISNRLLSSRVDGRQEGEVKGIPLTYSVWDIGRVYRYAISGHEREEIEIDLIKELGWPVPALPAHLENSIYEAYLVVFPGDMLAEIYDRWGARLLEQNVRVFLQARGGVNKGIRNTLEADPEMFFAYNNGITATAESVSTQNSEGGLEITGFKNLQIVNGGQTTASIHAASRKKGIDLSRVFVQMKLSIIDPARSEEIVPRISLYANSQNRVNAADFFSNHPFHLRIQEFSRRLLAPSPDGTFRESKWYYERARGQYQDARTNMTSAQIKRFELEYPKRQLITKTDLAKYINSWDGLPHIVSRGAQKNFGHFADRVGKEWDRHPDVFNEMYYRHAIAKAIIFRETEKLVTAQAWYQGGYRANIVAYAIAKLAFDMECDGHSFDLETVWKRQTITTDMKNALTVAARVANDVLISPPFTMSNVTEWAKAEACWARIRDFLIPWHADLLDSLRLVESRKEIGHAAIMEQKMLNGIEAQILVIDAGIEFWRSVKEWGTSRRLLTPIENGILEYASASQTHIPSEKQSEILVRLLKRLHGEGCQLGVDLV